MAGIEENIQRLGGLCWLPMTQLGLMPEEDVADLERWLGARLPASYRHFLKIYGECRFESIVGFTAIESLQPYLSDGKKGEISTFYGAATNDVDGVSWNIQAFRDRMPETIIPVGRDMMDSQICIGIAGPERGKIYFWDIEDEWDEEDYTSEGLPVPPDIRFQNVHLIANSFEEFFDQMYVREDG